MTRARSSTATVTGFLSNPANEDLLWLALAVGNSQFALEFYDHRFNNRLYASRRRFITQYVSEFPIPDPALALSKEIVALAKQVYRSMPSADADSASSHCRRPRARGIRSQGLLRIRQRRAIVVELALIKR